LSWKISKHNKIVILKPKKKEKKEKKRKKYHTKASHGMKLVAQQYEIV
jgi:hypothetical protein